MVDYAKESFVRRMLGEYDPRYTGQKFWDHVKAGLPWCELSFYFKDRSVKRIALHLGMEWKFKDLGPEEILHDLFNEPFPKSDKPVSFKDTPIRIEATCGELGRERVLWVWP